MTPGTVIGNRYELERLLGRGGMADVYLATDRRLSRKVAVKMLHRNLCGDEDLLARFRREAGASARLNHPSIVQVYDSGGEVDGDITLPYIVMEYIPGRTLREILNENRLTGRSIDSDVVIDPQQTRLAGTTNVGPVNTQPMTSPRTAPLAVEQAVSLTAGVLSALGYSHRKGVIHRDIKPGNVMLGDNGDIKVMDFGIARATTEATAAMTRTNAVVGTAQYMSPEQAKGESVDARSDIYSAGCLLYELLTGRPPFLSDTAVSLAYKHVGETPEPPSRFNPLVPASLDRVVMKALAKDRGDRYSDAESFRADLRAAQAGLPIAAGPIVPADRPTQAMSPVAAGATPVERVAVDVVPEPRRRRRSLVALALLALLAAGIALPYWWLHRERPVTMITVPDVYRASLADATRQLSDVGLTAKQGRTVASDEVAKGHVVDQTPQSRLAAPRGSEVVLTLSGGPAQVKVPNVSGMTQEKARAALEKAGLNPRNAEIANSSTLASDKVIKTTPTAGQPVLRGSAVDLTVSSGLVDLEDLTGRSQASARQWLKSHGLTATVRLRESQSTAGNVIGQNPGASPVPQGSKVILYVAKTPAPTPTPTAPSPSPTNPWDSRTWPSDPSATQPAWPPTPTDVPTT